MWSPCRCVRLCLCVAAGTELTEPAGLCTIHKVRQSPQRFTSSLTLCGPETVAINIWSRSKKKASNWCSDDTTGLIFCGKRGFGGPLINLSAMITTYIRGEYIRGGSGPLFFCPALQRGPGGALHAPASHDMLTGKQLIRCQKFIRPLFNIAYLSLACHFKTRGIA